MPFAAGALAGTPTAVLPGLTSSTTTALAPMRAAGPFMISMQTRAELYEKIGLADYEALDAYRDFGGIRIEDDIIVTETGSRMIGGDKRIPITVDELEAVVGR